MAKIKKLTPSDYKVQKWKNGQGTTSQLAIYPEESQFPLDPFLWRISSARINASGAFSQFFGCERNLRIIEGGSLRLTSLVNSSTETAQTLQKHQAYQFKGEDQIYAELNGAEVIDYNIIWNREKVKVENIWINSSRELNDFGNAVNTIFVSSFGKASQLKIGDSEPHILSDWESLKIELNPSEGPISLSVLIENSNSQISLTALAKL
jgi:environmental stress-induced protein Ves